MSSVKLIIFDLDGTLLDTLADLAHSTNYALEKNGFPPHPVAAYNDFVGNGINKLFERALPEGWKTKGNIANIRNTFLEYYEYHKMEYTRPYDGIPQLLDTLQERGVKMAVASNKYHPATENLVSQFFPAIAFSSVLGQREGIPVKPNPAVVYEILRTACVPAIETLYVGDSGVDMKTAFNSGVASAGVTWGFRSREELEAAGADYIVDAVADILHLII